MSRMNWSRVRFEYLARRHGWEMDADSVFVVKDRRGNYGNRQPKADTEVITKIQDFEELKEKNSIQNRENSAGQNQMENRIEGRAKQKSARRAKKLERQEEARKRQKEIEILKNVRNYIDPTQSHISKIESKMSKIVVEVKRNRRASLSQK